MSNYTERRYQDCECKDELCAAHTGEAECPFKATETVYGIGEGDTTGTDLCEACAEDRLETGLYSLEPDGIE